MEWYLYSLGTPSLEHEPGVIVDGKVCRWMLLQEAVPCAVEIGSQV